MQRFPREAEAGLHRSAANREKVHFRIVKSSHGKACAVCQGCTEIWVRVRVTGTRRRTGRSETYFALPLA